MNSLQSNIRICLVCLFILLSNLLAWSQQTAQQARADILRMTETYSKVTSYSMTITLGLYKHAQDKLPQQSFKGKVKRVGEKFFSELRGRIQLNNKNYHLLIDDNQKTIIYGKPLLKIDKQAELPPDSVLLHEDITYTYIEKGAAYFRLQLNLNNDATYKKLELKINSRTYVLEQIIYYYQNVGGEGLDKVMIDYGQVQLNIELPDAEFDEDHFIQKSKGKIIGAAYRSGYKVVHAE